MIPESRKEQGLLLGRSVTGEREPGQPRAVQPARDRPAPGRSGGGRARCSTASTSAAASQAAPAGALSGGNQQKLLFARMLLLRARAVLIADEPTRGVDVGAKRAIYELLIALAADGMACC